MKRRYKKIAFIVGGVAGIGIAAALVLNAFQSNMVFFFSPTQVMANEAPVDRPFRLGGLVKEGSIERQDDGLTVNFIVTDHAVDMPVVFVGILPDLFREGQGVVTQGRLESSNLFRAEEVLAKHDETYMPPEVAEALEKGQQAKAENDSKSTTTTLIAN
ncbi:MAG: cytochrome c maturation protein CcmE [Gammaproteobacteria bacterium]|nr:cytochrome c maturation protein CcmE [Gammaproteobacteria bacterium]